MAESIEQGTSEEPGEFWVVHVDKAKYEALIVGLKITKKLEVQKRIDSQLVVGQVKRDYEAREESMKKYL